MTELKEHHEMLTTAKPPPMHCQGKQLGHPQNRISIAQSAHQSDVQPLQARMVLELWPTCLNCIRSSEYQGLKIF